MNEAARAEAARILTIVVDESGGDTGVMRALMEQIEWVLRG